MLIKTLSIILLISSFNFSQSFMVEKIEPPNWWVGMKSDTLQLMVYGENLNDVEVKSVEDKIDILEVHQSQSSGYLFITLDLNKISEISSDYKFPLLFSKNSDALIFNYPFLKREETSNQFQGFDNNDVLYLIMADRFSDGNPSNNTIGDSLDEFTSGDLDGRKGGDIEGIISKLDYLKELGITTLWITPMLENNMWMSYHGYAATNLYKIDPRFGTNELFKKLVDEAHKRDLKVILDHVSNHIGINHPWIQNLPFNDWINGKPGTHLSANHNKMTFVDPYSPVESYSLTQEGWFTDYMPDLNQRNQYLKNYLIQNTLWWVEYLGVDGIREDTYPYADQNYLAEWAETILYEYPDFNIVGEIWTGDAPFLAAYQGNNNFTGRINSNLPSVTDFALADALRFYLDGSKGLQAVFNTLAQDIIYSDPSNLLTFIDNHDIARGLFLAQNDVEKFKLALTILLTTRGIPKLLYGTEIGIVGDDRHGTIRSPFPGGFVDDQRNAFELSGRTEVENDLFNYTQSLLTIRKEYKALSKGTLIHYYPTKDVYTYFRSFEDQKIMIIINDNNFEVDYNISLMKPQLENFKELKDLFTGKSEPISNNYNITLNKKSAHLYLLTK